MSKTWIYRNVPFGADFPGYRWHYFVIALRLIWAVIKGDREDAESWLESWNI